MSRVSSGQHTAEWWGYPARRTDCDAACTGPWECCNSCRLRLTSTRLGLCSCATCSVRVVRCALCCAHRAPPSSQASGRSSERLRLLVSECTPISHGDYTREAMGPVTLPAKHISDAVRDIVPCAGARTQRASVGARVPRLAGGRAHGKHGAVGLADHVVEVARPRPVPISPPISSHARQCQRRCGVVSDGVASAALFSSMCGPQHPEGFRFSSGGEACLNAARRFERQRLLRSTLPQQHQHLTQQSRP